MRLAFIVYFLTLVVVTASAAPNTDIRPPAINTSKSPESQSSKKIQLEPVQPTAPPPGPFSIGSQKSLFTASWNIGVGFSSGQFDEEKQKEELTTAHFQKTQYNLDESAQEFGVSVLSNGFLGADWGFKKFYGFTSPFRRQEPFYKIGVAGIYDPEDQLGNFIDYKKYFIQASFGFESLFSSRKRLRLEMGGRSGYPGTHAFVVLFYAFPD